MCITGEHLLRPGWKNSHSASGKILCLYWVEEPGEQQCTQACKENQMRVIGLLVYVAIPVLHQWVITKASIIHEKLY